MAEPTTEGLEKYKKAFAFIQKNKVEIDQCCGEFQAICYIPHRVEGPWSKDPFLALASFSRVLKEAKKEQEQELQKKMESRQEG